MKVSFMATNKLAAYDPGEQDRCFDQVERAGRHLTRSLALGADHHVVGSSEVVDCVSFAQDLRIRGDIEIEVWTGTANDVRDAPSGADRNRGFCHDYRVTRE
jgi:hypothetical protein